MTVLFRHREFIASRVDSPVKGETHARNNPIDHFGVVIAWGDSSLAPQPLMGLRSHRRFGTSSDHRAYPGSDESDLAT